MSGKRLLGILIAISGVALLIVAASTAAPVAKRGGTVVVDMTTDVDYIDPQLSYYGETWKLEGATACKLFNWPDKEGAAGAVATPEVAAGLPVISKDGKTYTFTIKPGFRFSNGKTVTAKSFVDAFNRFANPRMQSTGVQFLDIVKGAQAVIDGDAGSISGVKAKGNKLVVQLTKASPGLHRPDDDAVRPGHRPDPRRSDRRERDQPVRVVRPVLLLVADPGTVDHPQAQPVLQGRARVERRHDPGQHRQRRRRRVPERREGHLGLRVRRDPGDRVEERRREVRPQQEGRPRAGATAPRRPVRRVEPLATALQGQPEPRQGGQLGRRPPGVLGAGRVPVRQADGADPPAGDARVQAAGHLPAQGHREHDQAGEEARGRQPPGRKGRAVVVERGVRPAPGAADPVQPEADRDRRRGQAAPARAAVHERGQPEDGGLRPHGRAVGRRLRRPVRLREHPARRGAGHEPAAQQLRVLQHREVQQGDDGRVAPDRPEARRGLRRAGRPGDAREPAVGTARQLERPGLPLEPDRLHHDQRGTGEWAAAERGLRRSSTGSEEEGQPGGRSSSSHRETERCSSTSYDDFSGRASSSSE